MFFGGALLAIGVLNILFHRRFGRQVFRRSISNPPFFGNIWSPIGERGVQLFYLGVGIVLAVIGSVFMIVGIAREILARPTHI
jgi:hypothetical protein